MIEKYENKFNELYEKENEDDIGAYWKAKKSKVELIYLSDGLIVITYDDITKEDKWYKGGRIMFGLFDGIFDFDHDGKMDILEQAMEFEVLSNIVNANDKKISSAEQDFKHEDNE